MSVPTLRMVAGPDALDRIDRFFDALWSSHPRVPPVTRYRLGIAVCEIAANVVKHATRGLARPVDLQIWAVVRADHVLVTLVDDGIAAPEHLFDRELPDELDESGRGIPLARATLRTLQYRRTGGLNVWTLVSEHF